MCGVVVVVLLLVRGSDAVLVKCDFPDRRKEMQLIRVAERLVVRLPSSPPPRAPDNQQLLAVECSSLGRKMRHFCGKKAQDRQKPKKVRIQVHLHIGKYGKLFQNASVD